MKRRLLSMATAIMTLLPACAALACPLCKDSVADSDAPQAAGLPGGFNASIYYMLAGLFLTIGLCAGVIVKGVRDAQRHRGDRKI